MNIHHLIRRPSPDCETLHFLDLIDGTALPPIGLGRVDLHQIAKRESIKFFPQRAIREIFSLQDGKNPVEKILNCRCKTCSRVKAPSNAELKAIARKIMQEGITLLAIFIYIGQGYLIRYFGPIDRVSDKSLDSVTEHLRREENLEKCRKLLEPMEIDSFCAFYNSARDIFQPPRFEIGGPTQPFGDSYRMPFLDDEAHAKGGSGEVRKFNIHEDYLDEKIRSAGWYCDHSSKCLSKFKFARKILNEEATREIDSNIERENLAVFTRERHVNVVQAVCFYEWQAQMNFVFPFIEGTLEKLLSGKWNRPEKDYSETRPSPHNWLWTQMIGVAQGLEAIHNPQSGVLTRGGKRTIGFHFDLKPANILITRNGVLKISDFGLSFINKINPGSASYGYFRSGTPRYQAPEVSLRNVRDSYPFNTSSATGSTSPNQNTFTEIKNKYDIWSYACIAVEVLMFLFEENGIERLKQFESQIDSDQSSPAFFRNGKLKDCVEIALRQLSGPTSVDAVGSVNGTWARDTIAYLRTMFHFEPDSRPSSTEVARALQSLNAEHMDNPTDELETELIVHSRKEYPKERFDEVHWRTVNGDVSFIKMQGISFTWPDVPGHKRNHCKLNIYCNKDDGHFVIVRSFKEDNRVQSRAQSLAGAGFFPLYAYNQSGSDNYECGVKDRDMEVRYSFQSKQDLNSFQDVLLDYHLLYELDQSIESITFKGTNHEIMDTRATGFRVQVWAGLPYNIPYRRGLSNYPGNRQHSSNTHPASSDTSISVLPSSSRAQPVGESSKYNIMIFLEKVYICIPLSHGHPQLSYGKAGVLKSETIVVYRSSTTIKILPHRRAGSKNFQVRQTKSGGRVPAISLGSDGSSNVNPKTEHIELHFRTPEETQAFANAMKRHKVLQHYWSKCQTEIDDEKRGVR